MNTPAKERGNTLLQLYAATSSQKCCRDRNASTVQSLLADVPRQGDTRTVRHVCALQPWQSRATSGLPTEVGEKGNSFILPVAALTIQCCIIEDKPILYAIDLRRIWPATLQNLFFLTYGAWLCSVLLLIRVHMAFYFF